MNINLKKDFDNRLVWDKEIDKVIWIGFANINVYNLWVSYLWIWGIKYNDSMNILVGIYI